MTYAEKSEEYLQKVDEIQNMNQEGKTDEEIKEYKEERLKTLYQK